MDHFMVTELLDYVIEITKDAFKTLPITDDLVIRAHRVVNIIFDLEGEEIYFHLDGYCEKKDIVSEFLNVNEACDFSSLIFEKDPYDKDNLLKSQMIFYELFNMILF